MSLSRVIRLLIVSTAFCCLGFSAAMASPQILDKLRFGGQTYGIWQSPMTEFWHFGKGDVPKGKVSPPQFEVTSFNNWFGFIAKWEIRNSRLFLVSVHGQVAGQKLKNEALLPNRTFPVEADWFTGRIFLAVGDYSEITNEYEAVIVFNIDRGQVKSMSFLPAAPLSQLSQSLNGR